MWKSFPHLPHTSANAQLYDVDMVVVSQKLGRKCTYPPGLVSGTCGMWINFNDYIVNLTSAKVMEDNQLADYLQDYWIIKWIISYIISVQHLQN